MPTFDPGFLGVAGRAKRLQIARLIGQLRVRSDWLDMIHLKPTAAAAAFAAEAVALQNLHPQRLPALGAGHDF